MKRNILCYILKDLFSVFAILVIAFISVIIAGNTITMSNGLRRLQERTPADQLDFVYQGITPEHVIIIGTIAVLVLLVIATLIVRTRIIKRVRK